jgi:hypothetical protein
MTLRTENLCLKPWIKVGKTPVSFLLFRFTFCPTKRYNGPGIQYCHAPTITNAKVNGNVPPTSVDGSSGKNENGGTYVEFAI